MEYSKTFDNRIKITSRLTMAPYTIAADNFFIRFVFRGNEMCWLADAAVIHSDSLIILNKGTRFTSNIESGSPISISLSNLIVSF